MSDFETTNDCSLTQNQTPSNGIVYAVFLGCVLCHGILASSISKMMGKLQTVFVVMNFILIFATIIALPIGRASQRNDGHFIFANVENLTLWPKGWVRSPDTLLRHHQYCHSVKHVRIVD
jgi:hypothetical protein